MASKSDRLGLLSKMALFVRNPTKDWSDLERTEPAQESGFDKHALKAAIERKRQNDFVRRREFDQLRKLRKRDAGSVGGIARPSVFQTSIATDPDGRAVTLKKIDEIEAQMSKQWWKGKQDAAADSQGANSSIRSADPERDASLVEKQASPGQLAAGHFEPTQSASMLRNSGEFTETLNGSGLLLPPVASPLGGVVGWVKAVTGGGKPGSDEARHDGFSTSELFAIDAEDMSTDPELEEAAIRFANGDDAGAESGLLEALRQDAILPDVALSWAAALLDLYRATNNRVKFDAAVLEFAMRFDKMTPEWMSLSGATATVSGNASEAPTSFSHDPSGELPAGGVIWESPAELTVDALESLREVMASQPTPWHLGWSSIAEISDDAMPLLAGLFGSLCDEPVALRFSGVEKLVQTLRSKMPSGDRSVDSVWWSVRLNALRTMKLHDEFELAALDYCVTYEVSPPAWEPARCDFESVGSQESASVEMVPEERASGFEHATTSPMNLVSGSSSGLELRGDVLGDATKALASMGRGYARGDHIVISCKFLVRVDFSAAGSVLNWVAVRQAEGCIVQFKDVHRLVAAFFNVIGINEHARVIPRAI
jgi:hypothetical protein